MGGIVRENMSEGRNVQWKCFTLHCFGRCKMTLWDSVVCRSRVANVSSHQVAESAATSSSVSPRPLHHSMARGLSVIDHSIHSSKTVRFTSITILYCFCTTIYHSSDVSVQWAYWLHFSDIKKISLCTEWPELNLLNMCTLLWHHPQCHVIIVKTI